MKVSQIGSPLQQMLGIRLPIPSLVHSFVT
jgi:hypothetical protein